MTSVDTGGLEFGLQLDRARHPLEISLTLLFPLSHHLDIIHDVTFSHVESPHSYGIIWILGLASKGVPLLVNQVIVGKCTKKLRMVHLHPFFEVFAITQIYISLSRRAWVATDSPFR
jgi:hypothetical protein